MHGPNDTRIDDIPEPHLRPKSVKVKVAFGGLCGSDLGIYTGGSPSPGEHPMLGQSGPHVLGHEFSGYVVEVAEGVGGVRIGDLVVVRPNIACGECASCLRGELHLCTRWAAIGIHGGGGGFSEYVVVSSDQVHVVPLGVTAEVAALVEPLSVAWHAVRTSGASSTSSAFVIGAGPVGLGVVMALKAIGVSRVIVSEPSRLRRELARAIGADAIDPAAADPIEHVRSATGDEGVDLAFESSGASDVTFTAALTSLRPGGTAVLVGLFHHQVSLDAAALLFTEKRIVGSFGYWDDDFREVIDAIASGSIDPNPLISCVIPLRDLVNRGILSLLGSGRESQIKILVSP